MAHPDLEWTSEVAQQLEGKELVYRGLDEFRRYWDEWHAIWEVRIEVMEITDVGETGLRARLHGRAWRRERR